MKEQVTNFIEVTLAYLGLTAKHCPAVEISTPAFIEDEQVHERQSWVPPAARTPEQLALVISAVARGVHEQRKCVHVSKRFDVLEKLDSIELLLRAIPIARLFPKREEFDYPYAAVHIAPARLDELPDWPDVAKTVTEFSNALFGYGCALKAQAFASPVLTVPGTDALRSDLLRIGGMLSAMSAEYEAAALHAI